MLNVQPSEVTTKPKGRSRLCRGRGLGAKHPTDHTGMDGEKATPIEGFLLAIGQSVHAQMIVIRRPNALCARPVRPGVIAMWLILVTNDCQLAAFQRSATGEER